MTSTPFPEHLTHKLHQTGVIAVLMIDDADDAVPTAKALLAGGVDIIELTLRTPVAMEALRRIRAELPDRADAPADESPAQEHAKRGRVHGVVVCAAGQLNPSVLRVDAEKQPLISSI